MSDSDLSRLRDELQQIANDPDVPAHEQRIRDLPFSNSIKRLRDCLVTDDYQRFDLVNCFAFAFRLHVFAEFEAYQLRLGFSGWPGCVVDLLAGHQEKHQEIKPNDLVVYFDATGKPIHAGTVDDDVALVISKWGVGNVYQHGVYEVPKVYGNDARYYSPIPDDVEQRLQRHLTSLME